MKRPLRASLVLTIASSAAACARQQPATNPPPIETHNPPMPQPPPSPPACPAAAPLPGGACATAGLRCAYESCGVPDGATATCADGAWRVDRVTCNPPPPPATDRNAEGRGPGPGAR